MRMNPEQANLLRQITCSRSSPASDLLPVIIVLPNSDVLPTRPAQVWVGGQVVVVGETLPTLTQAF